MIIIAEFQQPTCFSGVSPANQSITSRFPPFGIHPEPRAVKLCLAMRKACIESSQHDTFSSVDLALQRKKKKT